MPSPGLGGSLQTAYVPVPEARPFILFQRWAREVFFFLFRFYGFFSHEHMLVSPPSPPAPPSPNVLLSLYRQPACCDLWVSTAWGSQTGKFPVYTRIPWKMSLVNLFLSLTSLNCEIIFLKPAILAFTNPEKQIGSLFCFHRAQNHTLTGCG